MARPAPQDLLLLLAFPLVLGGMFGMSKLQAPEPAVDVPTPIVAAAPDATLAGSAVGSVSGTADVQLVSDSAAGSITPTPTPPTPTPDAQPPVVAPTRATRPRGPVVPQRQPVLEDYRRYAEFYAAFATLPSTKIRPTETRSEALTQRRVRIAAYRAVETMLETALVSWWERPRPAPATWDHHADMERELRLMLRAVRLELRVEGRSDDPFATPDGRTGFVTACYTTADKDAITGAVRQWFELWSANWSSLAPVRDEIAALRTTLEADLGRNPMPCG